MSVVKVKYTITVTVVIEAPGLCNFFTGAPVIMITETLFLNCIPLPYSVLDSVQM